MSSVTLRKKPVCWLDFETTCLAPDYAEVYEMAFWLDPKMTLDEKYLFGVETRPLTFADDWFRDGSTEGLYEELEEFNKTVSEDKRLKNFDDKFFYHPAAFWLKDKEGFKPEDLFSSERKPMRKVLEDFYALIRNLNRKMNQKTRWILAGHNISYDFKVLEIQTHKCFGPDVATGYLELISSFEFLDTVELARWLNYKGAIKAPSLRLSVLCDMFNIPLEAHTAKGDIKATAQLAKIFLGESDES